MSGSHEARRRHRAAGASSAASTPTSPFRSASGTRGPCRRRAPAPRRGSREPARTAGTRCSRFAFIRRADTVHTRSATSISFHVASRTSPDLAAVSTRNSNASLTAGCGDDDARTVSIAAATFLCGSACRCVTMSFCAPSTGITRSHGLSLRMSRAMAHSSTERMRWRTARAVSALSCQIGVRISSRSAALTSETGRLPMRGKTYRSMLRHQLCACHRPRQPPRFCSSTRPAASAKVGTPDARRLSERGSPPERASLRFAWACSRASARVTSPAAPSPSSRRRPRMTSRWTQLRVPGRLDEQVQAVAVRVAPGRCRTDEDGREGLVGVASPALGSAGFGGGLFYNIHSTIIHGMEADAATRADTGRPRRRIINDY